MGKGRRAYLSKNLLKAGGDLKKSDNLKEGKCNRGGGKFRVEQVMWVGGNRDLNIGEILPIGCHGGKRRDNC